MSSVSQLNFHARQLIHLLRCARCSRLCSCNLCGHRPHCAVILASWFAILLFFLLFAFVRARACVRLKSFIYISLNVCSRSVGCARPLIRMPSDCGVLCVWYCNDFSFSISFCVSNATLRIHTWIRAMPYRHEYVKRARVFMSRCDVNGTCV